MCVKIPEEIRDKISKAKIKALMRFPFFGYILSYLKMIPSEKERTMGVDVMGNVYFNVNYVAELTPDQLLSDLCHEALHLVLEHPRRKGKRIHALWNYAIDIVTDTLLEKNGIPPGKYWWASKLAEDKTAEEVYDILIKNAKKLKIRVAPKCDSKDSKRHSLIIVESAGGGGEESGQGEKELDEGGGKGTKDKESGSQGSLADQLLTGGARINLVEIDMDALRELFGLGEEAQEKDRHSLAEEKDKTARPFEKPVDWRQILIEALEYSKRRGTMPLGFERYIEDLLEPPKLTWKEMLWKFIEHAIMSDYTFTRPSRRSLSLDVYLPSEIKEGIDVVVGLDVSGSISDREYVEFLSEVLAIAQSFTKVTITAVMCDAEVQRVIKDSQDVDALLEELRKRKGYGGTSTIPVFDWIRENKPRCKVLVYFTDGYAEFPEEKPPYPVLWIVSEEGANEGDEYWTKMEALGIVVKMPKHS